MISQRLCAIRAAMARRGVSALLVPTSDYHNSEYVGAHFKAREFLSGFTGSAGTLAVFPDSAALFTDSRYFLQAESELSGTGIELMRMGEPGVPALNDYLRDKLPDDSTLAVDGRCISAAAAKRLEKALDGKAVKIEYALDLPGEIWDDRPVLPDSRAWLLPLEYAGVSVRGKLADLRAAMAQYRADSFVLSALDDIAWLFNMRGGDIEHVPVILAYAVVEKQRALLFADSYKIPADLLACLSEAGVELRPYDSVFGYLRAYEEGTLVLADNDAVSMALYEALTASAIAVNAQSPVMLQKAVKNASEIDNLRRANIKDGAALTRFIMNIKLRIAHVRYTELSAAELLHAFRAEQEGFIEDSFDTICAYGPHAALPHYSATEKTDSVIHAEGFLLVDSGGHYLEGTTDITRTIAMGPLTDEQKRCFTLVLKGMLALQDARFLPDMTGAHLDILAREPLLKAGLHYKHGTGHGIGYLLSVHEGPARISYNQKAPVKLVPGMLLSDEPACYIEDGFGIRTENDLLVRDDGDGFLSFEPLTLAPVDLDAIDLSLLDETDRRRLNGYHAAVYERLSPVFDEHERQWLKEATRAV